MRLDLPLYTKNHAAAQLSAKIREKIISPENMNKTWGMCKQISTTIIGSFSVVARFFMPSNGMKCSLGSMPYFVDRKYTIKCLDTDLFLSGCNSIVCLLRLIIAGFIYTSSNDTTSPTMLKD